MSTHPINATPAPAAPPCYLPAPETMLIDGVAVVLWPIPHAGWVYSFETAGLRVEGKPVARTVARERARRAVAGALARKQRGRALYEAGRVTRTGPGAFTVLGCGGPYPVRVTTDGYTCACADAQRRGAEIGPCKHAHSVMAAMLAEHAGQETR